MGVLRPSVGSEGYYNLTFFPQDLVHRILHSVVLHIFGVHIRQWYLGRWPDLELWTEFLTVSLDLYQGVLPTRLNIHVFV